MIYLNIYQKYSKINYESIPDSIRKSFHEYISITLNIFLTKVKGDKQTVSNYIYNETMTLIILLYILINDFSKSMQLVNLCLKRGLKDSNNPSLYKICIYSFSDIINGLRLNNKYIKVFLHLIFNLQKIKASIF